MTKKAVRSPVTQMQADILKLAKLMQDLSINEPDFMKQSANRKLKSIYKRYKIKAKNQVFLKLDKQQNDLVTLTRVEEQVH